MTATGARENRLRSRHQALRLVRQAIAGDVHERSRLHADYERADPLPDLARPAAVLVPSPIRQAILAHLSEPRRLKEVAAHIGRSACSVYSHLDELRRRGLVARTDRGRYQRATATPGQAVAEPRPAGPA